MTPADVASVIEFIRVALAQQTTECVVYVCPDGDIYLRTFRSYVYVLCPPGSIVENGIVTRPDGARIAFIGALGGVEFNAPFRAEFVGWGVDVLSDEKVIATWVEKSRQSRSS